MSEETQSEETQSEKKPDEATPPDLEKAIDQLWNTYKVIHELIRFADTKAAALLAVNGVIITTALKALDGKGDFFFQHTPLVVLSVIAGGFLIVSAWHCLRCIRPNVLSATERSLIFFEGMRPYDTSQAFVDAVREASTAERRFDEIGHQVWSVAAVARLKYRRVTSAVRLFEVALYLCALILVYLVCFRLVCFQ